ncbi:MAG: ShlB/FhaC/HecB family hemolysin secretion/activation protein [Burkholderiales bacterium]|nr:ShlB/FhaC/HecB family hemolysin secretion/activation protein [Burkholderiales bacterium]
MAQTQPNASTIQQQIERDQLAEKQRLQIKPTPQAQVEAPLVGQTVVVKEFKFKGNTLLSSDELQAALAPLTGRPLDFARLQSSTLLVANLYRSKGWVVQTVLPGQDVDKGTVTIEIVEAVFGQTLVSGASGTLVSKEDVLRIFEHQQQAGQFLNINAIDRALLLADDLPGIAVSGALAQGVKAGQTDLILQMADEPKVTANVSTDNTGAVSTGSRRLMVGLNMNSPTSRGDALNINRMISEGSEYFRFAYGLPLGSNGWRVGLNTSQLKYNLISAAYKDLNALGNSTTTGLELSHPWVRTRGFNLNTNLSVDKKEYDNSSSGATTSAYKNTPMTLTLNGNSFDSLGEGGANSFSWAMTSGKLNLDGSPTQGSDAVTTQSAGGYKKIRYAFSRQQQLASSLSLYGTFSGQWANKNLDSSEKFYLGGSSGVRAYPSSEAGGTLGQMLNIELRWQVADNWNLTGFYDQGRISVNKYNDYSGAPAVNAIALKGSGLAVGWRTYEGLSLQASYARRIGSNPNPITTEINRGADQDGTLRINRFWLTASHAF